MAEDFRTILDNKASEAREARNRLERERKLQEFFREDIRELEFRLDQMSAYIASIEQGIMEIENKLKEPEPTPAPQPEPTEGPMRPQLVTSLETLCKTNMRTFISGAVFGGCFFAGVTALYLIIAALLGY